jgi:hypothetical protein
LAEAYGSHLHHASPVSQAPVMEVLASALALYGAEVSQQSSLLGRGPGVPKHQRGPELAVLSELERSFDQSDVFPAVWAS